MKKRFGDGKYTYYNGDVFTGRWNETRRQVLRQLRSGKFWRAELFHRWSRQRPQRRRHFRLRQRRSVCRRVGQRQEVWPRDVLIQGGPHPARRDVEGRKDCEREVDLPERNLLRWQVRERQAQRRRELGVQEQPPACGVLCPGEE